MRWMFLVAALACAISGCVSKWEVESDEAMPVGYERHRWVHYPESDVYFCDVHDHWFYRTGSGWTETKDLPFDPEGQAVPLETSDPVPYPPPPEDRPRGRVEPAAETLPVSLPRLEPKAQPVADHRWAFWPASNVFYCHVHDHYVFRQGVRWAQSSRSVDVEMAGPSQMIDDRGPQPWLSVEPPAAAPAPPTANEEPATDTGP